MGDLLVRGTNVLAVEVHQAVESSPQLNDAAFELEMKLRFFRMPSIPALRIVHRVGEVEFQWESGWVLEASETIAGPWVKIVTPASEYISPVGQSARRFFRLADR